jgi:hypothetical protein
MKVALLGEFSGSMLCLLLTIFNGANELRLYPDSSSNIDVNAFQFSKGLKSFSFKRLALD